MPATEQPSGSDMLIEIMCDVPGHTHAAEVVASYLGPTALVIHFLARECEIIAKENFKKDNVESYDGYWYSDIDAALWKFWPLKYPNP